MAGEETTAGALQKAWSRFWALPWKWKGSAIAVVLLIFLGTLGSIGGNEDVPQTMADEETATISPSPSPSETVLPTRTPEPTETPIVEPTSTNTPSPTPSPTITRTPTPEPVEWIPGLTAIDVTGNLEDRGFDCEGPRPLQTLDDWTCTSSATDFSWQIYVSVLGDGPQSIRSITASVIDTTGASERSTEFFGFLATVPYDDASPDEARAWVEDHPRDDAETTFGSARFYVSGPVAGRSLDIVALDAR